MDHQRLFHLSVIIAIVCLFAFGAPVNTSADVIFNVSADTSGIQGVTGSVDFQFNPGGVGTLPSTATMSNFSTDATGLSLNTTDGDVSGTLVPGPLVINNTFALNDVLENITFGTNMTFTLALSGLGVTSPDTTLPGSSFGFTFFDTTFNALLTADPAGTVLTLNLNPDGTTSANTFASDDSGSPSVVSVSQQATAVPEPSSLLLLGIGLTLIGSRGLVMRRPTSSSVRF